MFSYAGFVGTKIRINFTNSAEHKKRALFKSSFFKGYSSITYVIESFYPIPIWVPHQFAYLQSDRP